MKRLKGAAGYGVHDSPIAAMLAEMEHLRGTEYPEAFRADSRYFTCIR